MKLSIIAITIGLVITASFSCPDNDKECKAELKKCKVEYTDYMTNVFKCVKDSQSIVDVDKCKVEIVEPKKCEGDK